MLEHNLSRDIEDKLNNVSEETIGLLGEIERIPGKQIDLAVRLYHSLVKDGFTPKQARKVIENKVEMSYQTLMRALPAEAKSTTIPGPRKPKPHALSSQNDNLLQKPQASNARLVIEDEKPKLPQREETFIEPEPSQPELPPPPPPPPKLKHQEAVIPYPLAEQLSRFMLSRLIGISRGNGDPGVIIKINDQGEVYLP